MLYIVQVRAPRPQPRITLQLPAPRQRPAVRRVKIDGRVLTVSPATVNALQAARVPFALVG